MQGVLDDIKNAEKKASQAVDGALKEKEKIIEEARQKSGKDVKEKQKKVDDEMHEEIEKRKQELGKERGIILKKGADEAASLEKKADKNVKHAVDFVMKKFNDYLGG